MILPIPGNDRGFDDADFTDRGGDAGVFLGAPDCGRDELEWPDIADRNAERALLEGGLDGGARAPHSYAVNVGPNRAARLLGRVSRDSARRSVTKFSSPRIVLTAATTNISRSRAASALRTRSCFLSVSSL